MFFMTLDLFTYQPLFQFLTVFFFQLPPLCLSLSSSLSLIPSLLNPPPLNLVLSIISIIYPSSVYVYLSSDLIQGSPKVNLLALQH